MNYTSFNVLVRYFVWNFKELLKFHTKYLIHTSKKTILFSIENELSDLWPRKRFWPPSPSQALNVNITHKLSLTISISSCIWVIDYKLSQLHISIPWLFNIHNSLSTIDSDMREVRIFQLTTFPQRAGVAITTLAGITRAQPVEQPVVMNAKDGTARHPISIVRRMPRSSRMTHWPTPAIIVVIILTRSLV